MSNLTTVRLVPPSTAQSQDARPGVRPVPLSPSGTAESGPTGDKFGDKAGLTPTMRAGEPPTRVDARSTSGGLVVAVGALSR